MKKQLLFAAVLLLSAGISQAQLSKTDDVKAGLSATQNKDTVAWLHGGALNLGINQGFLHNWSAGGELASLEIDGRFSGFITRLYHKNVWTNNLETAYSLFYAYSNHFVPRKVDDRIDFTSKYGRQIDTSNFYLSGLFNFKSQFTKGFDYSNPEWENNPTSKFFSPAYLTLAIGAEYRRGTDLSLFLSPVAARATYASRQFTDLSPQGAFGIDSGKNSRYEFGAYFSGRYKRDFSKKVSFQTRLDLYANYLAKNRLDPAGNIVAKDNPGNVDIYWDNTLIVRLNKILSVTLGLTAIYDNDIPYSNTYLDAKTGLQVSKDEPASGLGWWQIKEVMTFGMLFKF